MSKYPFIYLFIITLLAFLFLLDIRSEDRCIQSALVHFQPGTILETDVTLLRGQVRDFDLNKEASPESDVGPSSIHSDRITQRQTGQVPSQATQASKKYKTPKTWRRIEIPVSTKMPKTYMDERTDNIHLFG